jgi:hypothetical protein
VNEFLALVGMMLFAAFSLFVTVGIWLIGAAALLRWIGVIA